MVVPLGPILILRRGIVVAVPPLDSILSYISVPTSKVLILNKSFYSYIYQAAGSINDQSPLTTTVLPEAIVMSPIEYAVTPEGIVTSSSIVVA
jgi:hypothetical protein